MSEQMPPETITLTREQAERTAAILNDALRMFPANKTLIELKKQIEEKLK